MEYSRRWGIVDAIHASALPPEVNYFITFSTRLTGYELHRIASPSIRETIERPPEILAKYRELSWPPFYKTQIGQQALEPVPLDFAKAQPRVDLRHGWRFLDFAEDGTGVTSRIESIASGEIANVRSRYLIACDGGQSAIRRALGIRMNGRGRMRPNVSFYFRSEEFLKVHDRGLGNLYFIFAPDCFGLLTAIDGHAEWLFQFYFLDPAKRTDLLDAKEVLTRAVGRPFEFELRDVRHWHHHQSVAREFRSRAGRVFLAGDAAHLFAPTGGVGMNTGIGDAIDLGWAPETLLESYERERKPIAVRNSTISANNSDKIDMVMDETPPEVEADGPEGERVRKAVKRKILWMAKQFNSAGTHLGYRYVDSPIVMRDGTPEPPDDFTQVVPSTWPGSRAPHGWLGADKSMRGESTLDWLGRDWVLVRARTAPAASRLDAAFAKRGMKLATRTLPNTGLETLYERPFVLVRPDGHVAWRGTELPPDCEGLADVVRGCHID